MRFWLAAALLLTSPLVARAAVTVEPPQAVSGKIVKIALCPKGNPDGLVLDNHALIRVPPHTAKMPLAQLQQTPVDVTGEVLSSAPNLVFDHANVRRDGKLVAEDAAPPPPLLQQGPDSGPQTNVAEITAAVFAADTEPDGRVLRLVLVDGTSVHIPHGATLQASAVTNGQVLTVHGVSKTYTAGRVARADSVTLNGKQLLQPEGGHTWETRAGNIARLWVNPHGDVDGVLLDNGTLVHFHPLTAAAAATLLPGQKVTARGAENRGRLWAATLLLADNKTGVDLDAAALPPMEPPRPLKTLTVDSKISQLWRTSAGDVDALLTADGTVVHVPPHLHAVADKFKTGQHVVIRGKGGQYPQGVAVEAAQMTEAS